MTLDTVNAMYEGFGALAMWFNVLKLWQDKQIKGVHWGTMIFFTIWGYWNMIYYPALNQWFSFSAGCVLALANTVWIGLAFYFWRRRDFI